MVVQFGPGDIVRTKLHAHDSRAEDCEVLTCTTTGRVVIRNQDARRMTLMPHQLVLIKKRKEKLADRAEEFILDVAPDPVVKVHAETIMWEARKQAPSEREVIHQSLKQMGGTKPVKSLLADTVKKLEVQQILLSQESLKLKEKAKEFERQAAAKSREAGSLDAAIQQLKKTIETVGDVQATGRGTGPKRKMNETQDQLVAYLREHGETIQSHLQDAVRLSYESLKKILAQHPDMFIVRDAKNENRGGMTKYISLKLGV